MPRPAAPRTLPVLVGWTAAGLVAATLIVLVLGLPGLVIAMGVVVLTGALGIRRDWTWPAAVAGGVLVHAAISAAGLVGLGYLRPGALTGLKGWGVLLLPILAGMVLMAVGWARGREPDPTRSDANQERRFLVPVLVTALGVVAAAGAVDVLVAGFSDAWAMSGDNRNHVLLARGVIFDGGLTAESFRAYPVLFNGLVAVHAVGSGRPSAPGSLLQHDIASLAATYTLTCALLAAVAAVFVAQMVGSRRPDFRGDGPGAWLVAVGAGMLVLSPVVLGTALVDGFFTGVGGLLVLLCVMVTASHALVGRHEESCVLAVGGTILLLTVWPPLALLAAPLPAAAAVVLLRERPSSRSAAVGLGCLAACLLPIAVFVLTRDEVVPVLLYGGSITRPSSLLLIVLVALLGYLTSVASADVRRTLVIPALTVVSGTALITFLVMLGEQPTFWSYYSAKTLWLLESCLMPLLVVPAAMVGLRASGRSSLVAQGAATASLVVLAVAASSLGTTLPPPLPRAGLGWQQPATTTAQAVMKEGNEREPYVFWKWNNAAVFDGEDRLANFWATAVWSVDAAGDSRYLGAVTNGPIAWAYTVDGTTPGLCDLADGVPGLQIRTRDPGLATELAKVCPQADAEVRFEPT